MLDRYVSTGGLPGAGTVDRLVRAAYERFRDVADGAVSEVYPALAGVDPDAFGICVEATDGRCFEAGDSRRPFYAAGASLAAGCGLRNAQMGLAVECGCGKPP